MEIINFAVMILSLLCSAIFSSLMCWMIIYYWRKRKIVTNGFSYNNKHRENYLSWLLRNGFTFMKKPSVLVLKKFPFIKTFIKSFYSFLDKKNLKSEPVSLLSVLIVASVFFICISGIIFCSFLVGLAIWFCLIVSLFLFIKNYNDKSIKVLREQIPETFRFMSSCFGAGLTIQQTFEQIVNESTSKIKSIFSKCTQVFQTGGSVSESLKCLQNIDDLPELAFVSVALDVQHQTGGNMQPVIDSAKDMIESKLELLRLLNVKTAQAKLSARIIIILPFALIAIFSIISPGFLDAFFSSPIGIILFSLACILEAAGIILVKKMLEIDL